MRRCKQEGYNHIKVICSRWYTPSVYCYLDKGEVGCNGKVAYSYINEKKERYWGYINQYTKIFKTKGEAEQYIKEQQDFNSSEFKGEM